MPTNDELQAAREAYDDDERRTLFGESGRFVSEALADAYIAAQQQRVGELERALEPFAREWGKYLEFRRTHTLSFGEWQRDYGSVDETHTTEAFAVLRPRRAARRRRGRKGGAGMSDIPMGLTPDEEAEYEREQGIGRRIRDELDIRANLLARVVALAQSLGFEHNGWHDSVDYLERKLARLPVGGTAPALAERTPP